MRSIIQGAIIALALSAAPAFAASSDRNEGGGGGAPPGDSRADMNTAGDPAHNTPQPSVPGSGTSGNATGPLKPSNGNTSGLGDEMQKKTAPAVKGAGHVDF